MDGVLDLEQHFQLEQEQIRKLGKSHMFIE